MTLDQIEVEMRVIYIPGVADGDRHHEACERGVVTSKNHAVAFVRYGVERNSKATSANDLVPL